MFFFYYCDYYFIFVLIFVFIVNFLKSKMYLSFEKLTLVNLFVLISKIMLLFIIFNIISLNYFSVQNEFKFNLLIIYKIIFYIFCFMIFIVFEDYYKIMKLYNFEHFFVFFFSIFSLSLIMQSNNFLNFYIILESYTLSICSVFVIKKINKKLIDASFKYFIFSVMSSCFMLFGISNIYFSSGLLNFNDINQSILFYDFFIFKNVLNYGYFLLLLGFFMKLAVFPFSIFLTEIYDSLPNIYVFFLLIFPKFAFVVFLFNNIFIFPVYLNSYFLFFIIFLLCTTSFIHSLMSVQSLNFKNIIINTSFSNVVFMILPLFYKSVFLLNTFFNFIILYSFNLICYFIIMLLLINKNFFAKKITSVISLFTINFPLTFLFVSNLLSLSSLPPFSGFFAKLYFFYFFIEFKLYFFYFFLSFTNLLVIYAYLRIIRLFFIKKQNVYFKHLVIKKSFLIFFLTFLTFFNIIFFFFFDVFYSSLFIVLNFNVLF